MTFRSSLEPLHAYRAGDHAAAVRLAEAALARNPFDAEARMTAAFVHFRRNEPKELVAQLKACLETRSAEWMLERLKQDLLTNGRPPLRRDLAFQTGAFFRTQLGSLGPLLPPPDRLADGEFINVVGTSYVRSFGGNPAFFPLFIGMGPAMLLLNEEQAAATRRRFKGNLARVDTTRPTILVLAGDAYYHVMNARKAAPDRSGDATPADFAIMDQVAARHAPILRDAKASISGRVMLLGVTPTQDSLMNELSRHLNERLKDLCAAHDVDFLDWWDELADPVSGFLRDDYCANAYPGDIHFTLSATKRFMELLAAAGHLSEAVQPSSDFEWTHVFECRVEPDEATRIWCEPKVTPNNAFKSDKVAAAHLHSSFANLLTMLAVDRPATTVLMANVRDGFLPIHLPAQVHAGCLAFTDSQENRFVGQQVLDFYGRRDVTLREMGELGDLASLSFGQVALLIHPDSIEADEARCNTILDLVKAPQSLCVATPAPERLGRLNLGDRSLNQIEISNRHLPERWRNFTLALAT